MAAGMDNPTSQYPLIDAVRRNDINDVVALIEAGEDVNQHANNISAPIYVAARNGYEDIVDALIRVGANVNYDIYGFTPIAAAVSRNHPGVITKLIEAKVDINQTIHGESLLHIAVRHAAPDSARVLLAHGADINACDNNNRTPLQVSNLPYLACRERRGEVRQLLHSAEQTLVKPARST